MKRKSTRLIIAALLLTVAALSGCGKTAEAAPGMTLDTAELKSVPSFWDWEQGGTKMQIIAIQDADETVRLAFNTCQNCNGSPYAYFEYVGNDTLQCQNCGLTFSTATVGTAKARGCNPFTISDFTVDGNKVTIPSEVLSEGAKLFENWKVFA